MTPISRARQSGWRKGEPPRPGGRSGDLIRRHFGGVEADLAIAVHGENVNPADRRVHFAPLGHGAIASTARQELQALERREGLLRRGLTLHFAPAVVDFVAAIGFSPRCGARPLQRAVEQHVVAAIARALFGKVPDCAIIEVDIVDGAVQARVC